MRGNDRSKSLKIILVHSAVIIALTFTVSTPAYAGTIKLNNHSNPAVKQKRQSVPVSSKAFTNRALKLRKPSSFHSGEIVLSAQEAKMIALVNQERANAGLNELEIDLSLVKLARLKSQDMVSYNYFGHYSERLGSIYDQLFMEGISYQTVAENLAGARDYRKANHCFLASPAHCSNILNSRFTKIGIGIARGGPFGMIFTEIFLG